MTASRTVARLESPLDLLHGPSAWLSAHWESLLVTLALGAAIYFLFEGLRSLGLALTKRLMSRPHGASFSVLRRAVQKTSHLFMAIAAARLAVTYADPPPHLFETVRFLFIVAAVLQGALWLRAIIFGFIDLKSDPAHGGNEALANASALIRTLVNATLLIIALIVILDNLGVNVTGLVAGLGIGGIAIGLAAQGIFSDLFASLSIILDRPFRVGETIDFGKGPATVERIGLKSTRLRAVTGERLIVSNAQLLNKEISSFAGIERRRYSFRIGLVYQIAADAAAGLPDVVRAVVESEGGHFVRAGLVGFGASSLDFDIQFDVVEPDIDAAQTRRHRIGIALFRRFRELGVSFAYPTQTSFTADPEGKLIMPYPGKSDAD